MPIDTIKVACKLPNGLHLDLEGFPRVTLAGANAAEIVGGFGVTEVPKDMWDAWSAAYKDFGPLKEGLIFARPKEADVKAQAKEQADVKTGLEGIDPAKPAPKIEPAKAD